MNQMDEQSARAAGMMRIALRRMAQDFPFHANILSFGRVAEEASVRTVAVTLRDNSINLLYGSNFVCACSLNELVGVLHHEVNHIVFGHLFADPQKYPDRRARLIAEEVTVNEFVREPLPGRPILLAQFPQLPANEDTDTRYQKLAQDSRKRNRKFAPRGSKKGNSRPKTDAFGEKSERPSPQESHLIEPLDNHDLWREARAAGPLGKMIVKVAVLEAMHKVPPDQVPKIPMALRQQLDRLCQGFGAGNATERINRQIDGQTINWRQLLRRYVRHAAEVRPAFSRPPRRFPKLVGIVPGRVRQPGRPRIMVVVDTSGSIESATLERITAELERMCQSHEIVIVEADCRVQRTYPYSGPLTSVKGRGGTDLRPPLNADFLKSVNPDLIIYFTDGFGRPPQRAPLVPLIWCLTASGQRPAPWGKMVRMIET